MRQAQGVDRATAEALRAKWLANPSTFCADALGFEPWDHATKDSQRAILDAIRPGARISVRSGHKVGKSRTAAAVALYCGVMFPGCRVVMTAPTYRQVDEVLWRELRTLHSRARMPLGGTPALVPSGGLNLPTDAQVLGFTTDKPDAFSGISGPLVVYLADEASGIDERIFEAIDGNSAGGSIIMLTGNPTQLAGRFHATHHALRDQWQTFHIDSETVIEVTADNPIPGLATRAWEREMAAQYGEDSAAYAVRVRGDFPSQGSRAIITLASVTAAKAAWGKPPEAPLFLGVDPARYGDDETVIQPIRGNHAFAPVALRKRDTMDVAGEVLRIVREMYVPGDRETPCVHVDEIGIGAGVLDALKRSKEVRAYGVNVSTKALDADRYRGLRDQLWFGVAEWLKGGGTLPPDEALCAELVAAEYKFDARGRYEVEAKESMRGRLGRSPDRADALALGVYRPMTYAPRALHIPGL